MEHFDGLLKKPSLFKDESKLDVDFIPEKLPHRDKELSLLSQLFLPVIKNPNTISRNLLITGSAGTGKTVTLKYFAEMLKNVARNHNVPLEYAFINCRKEKTSFNILAKVYRTLKGSSNGVESSHDYLKNIEEYLEKNNLHIILILDKLPYLSRTDKDDLLYSLIRINDDSFNNSRRISIIGIVRDLANIANFDNETITLLCRNVIKFEEYSKMQVFDILTYRAELSLKENVLSDEMKEYIAGITTNVFDALNILWRAATITETKNLKYITVESISLGFIPFQLDLILKAMSKSRLILLLTIVRGLLDTGIDISFLEIQKRYWNFCESIRHTPRTNAQIWGYLQALKSENIIKINLVDIKTSFMRGTKAIIKISDIPLPQLEQDIIELLVKKGLNVDNNNKK